MKDVTDVIGFVETHRPLMRVLAEVEALGLPDCWVAAGAVRNAIWSQLHGFEPRVHASDVDVVFFDREDPSAVRDARVAAALSARAPDHLWSVKNQARMYLRNGDPPYRDTADAMAHWPETCTAVAVRLVSSKLELQAPFGVRDLLDLVVRPTPWCAEHRPEAYRQRLAQKRWAELWPLAYVMDCCIAS